MLVANESQETIGVFAEGTGAHLRDVDLKSYGIRPRGVKVSPQGNSYAVTMETSGTLLTMDQNFNVIKAVPTAAKPYGLSFDRAGKRIFVSAALAGKLQVFSADSLQLLAEVPTGKRCWHFTFTPDDSKILLACGRSNNRGCDRRQFIQTGRDHRGIEAAVGHCDVPEVIREFGIAVMPVLHLRLA